MKVLLIFPRMPLSFFSYSKAVHRMGCKALFPSLSLITVAAMLPREWHLRLVDENVEPVTEQMWAWTEMVMISGMVIQGPNLLALIREAKARGKTVVVGGAFSSSMPEEVLQAGADFLIRGEAENILPLFLAALAQGLKGRVIECDTKPDLATSPIPRFDLLDLKNYANLAIQTSRGCPHNCEFCDVVQLYGRRPRYKEPRQVVAELETIYRLGWRGPIFISDDNFIGNKTRARAILRELIPWSKSRGEPFGFTTQTTLSLGQDLALMNLMTEANFCEVFLGIESPDEEVLISSQKYHNHPVSMQESLHQIQANGLSIIGSFILGLDGETPGAGDRIISFIEAASIPLPMVQLLQPPPNTRLWRRLQQEGRLLLERMRTSPELDSIGRRPFFIPSRPEEQIIAEYLKVWATVYEPRRFLARTYRFFLGMRPTRAATARRQGKTLTKTTPSAQVPLRQKILDAYMVLTLFGQLGIVASTRWQFWRQLMGILRNNPTRIIGYLVTCIRGEDMFHLRDLIRQRLTGSYGQ